MSSLLSALLIGLISLFGVHCASRETFGFTNFVPDTIYKKYDLSKISSLVFLDNNIDDKLLEYARSKNVQTYLTGSYPAEQLGNSDFRSSWVKQITDSLLQHKANGLHLDFQQPISRDDPKRAELTNLVKYLKQNLVQQNAKLAVSVPWSPINKNDTATNGQDYDYLRIAQYADYLLVKSFHINRQIFVGAEYDDEVCLAKSNQGFFDAAGGLLKWIYLNESDTKRFNSDDLLDFFGNDLINGLNDDLTLRNKIILVYPWFGLDYTCQARVERQRCLIEAVSFIDSNCSDRVATEVPFKSILKQMYDNKLALFYDPHSRSTYLEYSDNTHVHQLWFDYFYDYTFKYMFPGQFNLRGMGVYRLDYLEYAGSNADTTHMWNLLPKLN